MDETTKKVIERVTKKQQKFWLRLFTILAIVFLVVAIAGTALVSFVSRYMERRDMERIARTPEEFINKPFIIEINLRYEISVGMQVQSETFKKSTVYCYNNEVAQTDSTPDITGTDRIVAEGLIAVSQDNWGGKIRPGDLIFIKKLNKWYLAEDAMNVRHKNSFDVFFFKQHKDDMFSTLTSDVIRLRVTK